MCTPCTCTCTCSTSQICKFGPHYGIFWCENVVGPLLWCGCRLHPRYALPICLILCLGRTLRTCVVVRVHVCHICHKGLGMTLHSSLYFHPQPGSRPSPIKFLCLTTWPHWKFGLNPRLFSISHTHWALGETLTISITASLDSLLDQLQKCRLDCLTFDSGHKWEYSCLCSVILLMSHDSLLLTWPAWFDEKTGL